MSRPRTEDPNRVSTTIRLDPETHERLIAAARDREVSANFLINRAVSDFLDRLLPAASVLRVREDA